MGATRIHLGMISVLCCAVCSTVSAQPIGTHRDSLQWMITRADVIVRGRVESVDAINSGSKYIQFYQVAVQVQAGIAGVAGDRVCFVSTHQEPFVELKKHGHDGLFFLVDTRVDFDRQRHARFYYFFRCPFMCRNVIDLDAESVPVASFDAAGIKEVQGAAAILAKVDAYLPTRRHRLQTRSYGLREPNGKAFTGYDASLSVPLDQHVYAIGNSWSVANEKTRRRVGKEVAGQFSKLLEFDAAREQYADRPQIPTGWHHANTLNIDTLEWMTADSDLVVWGTIDDLVMVQKGDYDSQTDFDSSLDIHLVKFRVGEIFKGECEDTISVALHNGGKLSQWREKKTPVALFLRDLSLRIVGVPKRTIGVAHNHQLPLVRYAGRGADTKAIIALDADHPRLYSLSNGWIGEPQRMLAVVRKYLAKAPAAREPRVRAHNRVVNFKPPESFLKGTPWDGDQYVRVNFPIDGYLEEHARRWLTSDDKEQRWLGAYCLIYFQSDENAQALRKLLDDPGKWPKPMKETLYPRLKVTYLVRWEAWAVLDAWGYEVAKPRFSD